MLARYYSQTLGRFASPDPHTLIDLQTFDPVQFEALLTDPQVWNRYTYVFNNPIYYRDPDGRFAQAAVIPVMMIPGMGQVVGAAALLGLAAYAAYEAGEAIAHYASNAHQEKLAMGQIAAAMNSLAQHGNEIDPEDPKWKDVIKRIRDNIKKALDIAKKINNKDRVARIEEAAKRAQDLLDASLRGGGTHTAPKGPIVFPYFLPPEKKPEVKTRCEPFPCE